VLAPPVLVVLWFGSPWLDGLLLLGGAVMVWEWARMCGARSVGWLEAASILAVAAAVLAGALYGIAWACLAVAAGTLVAGAAAALRRTRQEADGGFGWFALGILYVGLPVVAFQWLRGLESGRELIVWLILVVWATDIGAFAVGKTLGGPKLWARVSPNKTWSGGLGGVAAATLLGCIFAVATGNYHPALLVAFSAVTSVAAQAGDFFESFVKRRFRRKDTSSLIPGHGGLLDRVDGLIGGTLAVAAALALWEIGA
jgi:phosphatidate cytidylyltransferase